MFIKTNQTSNLIYSGTTDCDLSACSLTCGSCSYSMTIRLRCFCPLQATPSLAAVAINAGYVVTLSLAHLFEIVLDVSP